MTRQEYERWRFETELVEEVLVQIERGVKGIVKAEGWPTGVEDLTQRLATIPKKKRRRAVLALHALAGVRDIRQHLGPVTPNAARAAAAALRAGAIATTLGIELWAKPKNVRGGTSRGKAIAETAQKTAQLVQRHSKRWRASDEPQDEYRSEAAYVAVKTGLGIRTVQRALRRLYPRQ